ncbi:MAG: iron ABC transporter substrate-binding protein, partial [Mesorhizobium sp.]
MKYALSALAGAAALAISLIVGPAMAQDGGIVVYNAQHESLTDAWVEG